MASNLEKLGGQIIQPARGISNLSSLGGQIIQYHPDIDEKHWATKAVDYLTAPPKRFGKQLTNVFSHAAKEVSYAVGGGKLTSFPLAYKLNKHMKVQGIIPPPLRTTQKRVKAALMKKYDRYIPEFDVKPATTTGEHLVDIAAGVTGFVAELALLKKTFPAASGAKLWEIQNLMSGGTPGIGAATYGAFKAPTKLIKGIGIASKAAQIAAEATLIGSVSAIESKIDSGEIDWKRVAISASIPVGLRTVGIVKSALRNKNPKVLKAINDIAKTDGLPTIKGMAETDKILMKWAKKTKSIRKIKSDPAMKQFRGKQATAGTSILKSELKKGTSEYQAIQKSQLGYKGKAKVFDVEPPPLNDRQWNTYAKKILQLFPADSPKVQYSRTNTLKALDQLRNGKIPTYRQWELLEPIFGKSMTEQMFVELASKKAFSGWEIPGLTIQFFKTKFGFDIQTIRQARSLTLRHPVLYTKSSVANIRAYVSKRYANKANTELINSPGYKESAKHVNYASTTEYSQKRLEQFKLGLTERAKMVKFKTPILEETLGKGIRAYGRLLHASERGAVVGINTMMKGMWDVGQKQKAQLPHMTVKQSLLWDTNRGKTINTFMKILHAKNPTAAKIQHAANYILFSPSMTASRPLSIKALVANKGSRAYAGEIIVSNIATIFATTMIPSIIASQMRQNDPMAEPPIDGELNPLKGSWGKIRWGDSVFDFSGGDAPFYRTLARLGVGAYLQAQEAATGKQRKSIGGTTIPPIGETIMRYGETRETAALGLAKTLLTGKDWMGEDISGIEALVRAMSPEIIEATIETGMADGTWETLATMITTAASVGVSKYSVRESSKRAKFRDTIAEKEHGLDWDLLDQKQQRMLKTKYRKQFTKLDEAVKAERVDKPFDPARIIEEERQSGIRISKMLSEENQSKVLGVSVGVSRSPKKFYLNDERYQYYQEAVAKHLNQRLNKINLNINMSQKVRTKKLEAAIKIAKTKAYNDLRRKL